MNGPKKLTTLEKLKYHQDQVARLKVKLEQESEIEAVREMKEGLIELYGTTDIAEIMKIKNKRLN